MTSLQRRKYDGIAREEAEWWTLRREATKGAAVCRMVTHIVGHELRLEVRGQIIDSQVCCSGEDVLLSGAVARRYRGEGLGCRQLFHDQFHRHCPRR